VLIAGIAGRHAAHWDVITLRTGARRSPVLRAAALDATIPGAATMIEINSIFDR
jgi:hypothetical protein